jgi:hypothetical protein
MNTNSHSVRILVIFFCVVTIHRLVDGCKCFWGMCYLQFQGWEACPPHPMHFNSGDSAPEVAPKYQYPCTTRHRVSQHRWPHIWAVTTMNNLKLISVRISWLNCFSVFTVANYKCYDCYFKIVSNLYSDIVMTVIKCYQHKYNRIISLLEIK